MNWKKWIKYALHVAVLLGIVVAAVKYVDGETFLDSMRRFNWGYAPLVVLLGWASLLTKSWRFSTMMKEIADVPRWVVIQAYVAGQSATLLPGGIAARAGMLDEVGVPASKSAAVIALSSFTDQLGFLLAALVCSTWFESARQPVFVLLAILTLVSVLLGLEATREWLLQMMEKLLAKFRLAKAWRRLVESFEEVLTWPILLSGMLNTAVAFTFLIWALDLSVRGVGGEIGLLPLVLAFALPTMLGRISALPGGVGITEAGMAGIIQSASDISLGQAVAAVTVFRLGTVLMSAIAGGAVYWTLWRKTAKRYEAEPEAAS